MNCNTTHYRANSSSVPGDPTVRRYAIVAIVVVAAIFTPPDPISQLMLAIPIVLLYEVSIVCVWLMERRRRREDEAAGTDIVPV